MARRSQDRSFIIDDLFPTLRQAPVWVGPTFAAFTYIFLRWAAPWFMQSLGGSDDVSKSTMGTLAILTSGFAPFLASLILLTWIAAEIAKVCDRVRLNRQTGAGSIRDLSWQEFESLLAETFRRQGFAVEHTGASGPDGGIDLRLSKAGAITLVQCKHWKAYDVGVRIVRELRGIVASDSAQSGIVVTSGRFTRAAHDFAVTNPIRLIDGHELVGMIAAAQKSVGTAAAQQATPATSPKQPRSARVAQPTSEVTCPLCSSPMVRRTAKRGPNVGSSFLGCSRYPDCRGIRDLAS